MRAYLAIKYHPDQQNRAQIEKLTTLLADQGVQTICIARDVEHWGTVELTPPKLMDISFAEIDACDIVIVELSEKGVGLGIEAGYAYAQGIPVVTIARRGADVSATLRGISTTVFQYETYEELAAWFQQLATFSNPPGAITDRDRNPAPASRAT